MKPFFVYLLRCADGTLYVGHTDELDRRLAQHAVGEVAGYTSTRRPVELVWSQETASREEALAAEFRIKGWSRAKKEALIRGDWAEVKRLARNRSERATQTPVRPEPVEGPVQGLRQAQPERGLVDTPKISVRPELVEGPAPIVAGLPSTGSGRSEIQAQPERELLTDGVLANNRRALAKAITLLESTRPDHRQQADALLNAILPHTGKAIRIGISGVPGVGKSTFIEALGLALIQQGHKVAVLAIDPSSSISGGSILGDKTRMEQLSVNEHAFIRPSPSSGTLGGVAEKTRETMLVCEAAGHDVVIVETVGVGQSETAVARMTDLFVLLQLPNAGDELQAIKRGVMELADLVVINKADLDPDAATRAQAQIAGALRVYTQHGDPHPGPDRWHAKAMQLSALKAQGIETFWQHVCDFKRQREASGEFAERRQQQAKDWMWDLIQARLQADFKAHTEVKTALPTLLQDVLDARIAPSVAARTLLDLYHRH